MSVTGLDRRDLSPFMHADFGTVLTAEDHGECQLTSCSRSK